MSDPKITPRSAAFQQQPKIAPTPEAHAASEFATHGDPSLKSSASAGESAERGKVRVEWVYATELGNRLAARGMAASADVFIRAHHWLRQQGNRKIRLPGRRKCAPPASQPPKRSHTRRVPDHDDPGRSAIG